PLELQSVAAISEDLYALAYDQPFRFPATFTFVLRAFSTLEGVGRGLDENFQFFTVAAPYALQLMDNRNRQGDLDLLGELGRQAAQMGNSALSLPRRLETTLTHLERGDLVLRTRSLELERLIRRLSAQQASGNYHVLTGSLLICATILLVHGYGWLAGLALLGAGVTGWRGWRAWQRHERIERMF
ncbi:MAG: AarF/ABC1/UbiB kinase family protein, partial [Gloeomargarita sp. GMQP_bins_44]